MLLVVNMYQVWSSGASFRKHLLHWAILPQSLISSIRIWPYVKNSNTSVRFEGNLFEVAQTWYHFKAGYTNVRFSLHQKTPNLYTSFNFCSWFSIAHSVPLNFNMNNTCLKNFKAWYSRKKEVGSTRLPGLGEFDYGTPVTRMNPRMIWMWQQHQQNNWRN